MTIREALQIVLELATQNLCDDIDHPKEHSRQNAAIVVVEALMETHYAG